MDDCILRNEFINAHPPVVPIVTPQPLRIYINKVPGIGEIGKVGFTKDEIMAMPTLILMTTSGESLYYISTYPRFHPRVYRSYRYA